MKCIFFFEAGVGGFSIEFIIIMLEKKAKGKKDMLTFEVHHEMLLYLYLGPKCFQFADRSSIFCISLILLRGDFLN